MPRFIRRSRRRYGRRSRKSLFKRKRSRKRTRGSTGVRRKVGTVRTYGLAGPTLQIATRVQPNLKLKFVYNQTFTYNPGAQKALGGKQQMMLVGFSANTIKNLHCDGNLTGSHNTPGTWLPQSSGAIIPSPDADGYDAWKSKYTYGTVIGSKITVVAKSINVPHGDTEPALIFLHKTGSDTPGTVLTTQSGAEAVNVLPYVSKSLLMSSNVSTGTKLSMGYSAKKFEGAKTVIGNDSYKFAMDPYVKPEAETSWIFGICNARGHANQPNVSTASGNCTPPLMIQVKIEYVVVLTEPKTAVNPPPAPGGMMPVGGGGASGADFPMGE